MTIDLKELYPGMKQEIMKHPLFKDFEEWRIMSTLLDRTPTPGFYTPKQLLQYQIDLYNNNIADLKNAVAAAVRSDGRLRSQYELFDEAGCDRLKKYVEILDTILDDDTSVPYLYMYWGKKHNAIGLVFLVNPVIVRVVPHHVETCKCIKLGDDNKFHLVDDKDVTWLQAYDIMGGEAVGEPFPEANPIYKQKMYAAVEKFAELLNNGKFSPDSYVSEIIDVDEASPDGLTIDDYLNEMNELFAKADVRRCKQCFKRFVLSDREKKWYSDKGYSLPGKCFTCRQRNRRARAYGSNSGFEPWDMR